MGGVNLPTTSPLWIEQRIADDLDLTPQEQKVSDQQDLLERKMFEILKQPVAKGDMKAARARVDELKRQFESLSPEMKEYLYNLLQTDMGKMDLAHLFHYKLSSPTRDALLKSLNPNHRVEHIEKETINSAISKIEKATEKDLEGMSQMHKLNHQLNKNLSSGINGLVMNDAHGSEGAPPKPVHRDEAGDLSMRDTATGQGFMLSSTKEIKEPKKDKYEIAVEDPETF